MGIIVNLDVMMAKRKKNLTDLAAEVDITLANLSILKNSIFYGLDRIPLVFLCFTEVLQIFIHLLRIY